MDSVITSWSDLQLAVDSLPPLNPCKVRVFRGQTRDYPTLLPNGLRKKSNHRGFIGKDAAWFAYSGQLYSSLLPELAQTGSLNVEMLQSFGIWFHAIAQHYGPGSRFLDVTHSLDVAVWFALHKSEVITAQGVVGPPGPFNPETDDLTVVTLTQYKKWTEPAVLYVFDLPKWNGKDLPRPGELIDLAEAPDLFSSSPRIKAQSACLVDCYQSGKGLLDLRSHLVPGSPIRIGQPMKGTPELNQRISDLFPSPAIDAWYARFLCVPLSFTAETTPPVLQRSTPVVAYFEEGNDKYMEDVIHCDIRVPLPLIHRSFEGFVPKSIRSGTGPHIGDAISIVLEAPFIFPFPPGESDLWHHGLLVNDLPNNCAVYEFGSTAPFGRLSLNNVLFEFSLLETTGWDKIVTSEPPTRLKRGIWIRREKNWFAAIAVQQTLPGGQLECLGPIDFAYDSKLGQLVFINDEKTKRVPLVTEPKMAKDIIVGLMLMGHLSTVLKPAPTPALCTLSSESQPDLKPKRQFLVRCSKEAARLYRVRSKGSDCDWFVIRDSQNPQEPFTASNLGPGILTVESYGAFRDYPVERLLSPLTKYIGTESL